MCSSDLQAAEMHQRDKADEYYRMAECIAYGTHYDVVRTYDAAMTCKVATAPGSGYFTVNTTDSDIHIPKQWILHGPMDAQISI